MKTNYQLNIGSRKEQQDNCAIFKNKTSTFLVLGDGMGGHKGGAVASQILIREAKKAYGQQQYIKDVKLFFDTIIKATTKQLQHYKENHGDTDPKTTAVFGLLQNDQLYSGHIGDSRAYLFDESGLVFRTKDHSVVQMLVNMQEITEEEMATHPDQNKLLKSISVKSDDCGVSFMEITIDTQKPFLVLLCSDGFWEYIDSDEMYQLLHNYNDSKVTNLVNLAKQRGSTSGDNISVALCINEIKPLTATQKIMKFLNKEIF